MADSVGQQAGADGEVELLPMDEGSLSMGGVDGAAVLYVTTGNSGLGDQQPNHGSDSTADIDIGGDNYQRLIEDDQEDDADQATTSVEPSRTQQKGSGIVGASFNIINSIVGAGIIGIPAAIREAGFSTGVVLLVLVGVLTDYTLYILVSTGISVGCFSYQEVMRKAFGRIGYIIVTIAQFLLPFFGMVGYIVIVGDTVSGIISGIYVSIYNNDPPPILVSAPLIKLVCILLVMLPVSSLRNIASLEKFSGIAVFLMAGLQVIVLYEIIVLFCAVRCYDFVVMNETTVVEPEAPCCHGNDPSWYVGTWFINYEVFSAVGILSFAYVCHHNIFMVYNSLKNKTMKTYVITSNISVFTAAVFLSMLGTLGYLTFQGNTQGDLLNSYCRTDHVANAARAMYTFIIMLTYPIELHVTREVVELALQEVPRRWMVHLKNGRVRQWMEHFLYTPLRKSLPRHIFLTLLLVGLTAAIGIPAENLEAVLAISGCLTATAIAFIFPAAVYLKLVREKDALSRMKQVTSVVVLVFGVLVMFIGTGSAIYRAVVTEGEPAKLYCSEERRAWADTLCPTEGFSNLSSTMVAPASSCDCGAVFHSYQPAACANSTL